jgi:hypothetical protein
MRLMAIGAIIRREGAPLRIAPITQSLWHVQRIRQPQLAQSGLKAFDPLLARAVVGPCRQCKVERKLASVDQRGDDSGVEEGPLLWRDLARPREGAGVAHQPRLAGQRADPAVREGRGTAFRRLATGSIVRASSSGPGPAGTGTGMGADSPATWAVRAVEAWR